MNLLDVRKFLSRHQALWITAIYLAVSGIWVYISNYLLFSKYSQFTIHTVGELEAVSDAGVVLVTAVLLYALVSRSFAKLRRSEQALKHQAEQLQVLSHKLIEIQENERRAIAKELHDEIGQALTALKRSLEMANLLPQDQARESASIAFGLADDLTSRVRQLSLNLRPVALDDLGLLPALLWYLERYSRQTGVQTDFRHQDLESRRFGHDIETAAYRIIQEGLTNVARHARSPSAEVRVWVEDDSLNLSVDDQGIGFDAEVIGRASSIGLVGMQERASVLGGSFVIETRPGGGTHLMAELPLSR